MANFDIEYNPYREVTVIKKNGIVENPQARLSSFMNRERLQNWFNETDGWSGLGKVIDEENNDELCSITFRGRNIDFEDLQDYFKNHYKSQYNTVFNLVHIPAKNDSDILEDIKTLIDKVEKLQLLEKKQLTMLRSEYNRLINEPFVISVIATMSSGKSTLINSLLRKNLLPTGDMATTATTVEIEKNNIDAFEAKSFDLQGNLLAEEAYASLETMEKFNKDKNTHNIKVKGNIPGIKNSKISLMLRDTPGPNNSQTEKHREITESLIRNRKDMSLVIYVMNATNLAVDSDKKLLESIAKEMKKNGKQAKDRFLFVINKADSWIEGENQTVEELLIETRKYLKKFEIVNPNLFPVSASLANRIWMKMDGHTFKYNIQELLNVKINHFSISGDTQTHFENFATLSPSSRETINGDLQKAVDEEDNNKIALIHTGIPALEIVINEYLDKYAYPIKIAEAVEEFQNIIDEKKMRSLFLNLIKYDEEKMEEVKLQIETIKSETEKKSEHRVEFERKLNEYQLDSSLEKKAKKDADSRFKSVIDSKLSGIGDEISVNKAKDVINSFTKDINMLEKELNEELQKMIEVEVYNKGKQLLEDYKKYMIDLKKEINVHGFDINRVASLKKFDFKDLKEVTQKKNTKDIYETKTVEKTVGNQDWKWWTFWKPQYNTITVTHQVKVGESIKGMVIQNELIDLSMQTGKNISDVFKTSESQIEIFKENFKDELGKLDVIIDEIVTDLKVMVNEKDAIGHSKDNYIERIKMLDGIIIELKQITEI